jgi:hypothetical protein
VLTLLITKSTPIASWICGCNGWMCWSQVLPWKYPTLPGRTKSGINKKIGRTSELAAHAHQGSMSILKMVRMSGHYRIY